MTNTNPPESLARPISELVPPFPSVDWLARRLSKGVIPGTKLGRTWVMTDDDVRATLEIYKNRKTTPSGITARSARLRGMTTTQDHYGIAG